MKKNSSASWLDRFLSRAVAFVAIISIPAGLLGYCSNQHDKRVQTTFDLYKVLKTEPLQGYSSLLTARWNEQAKKVNALLSAGDQESLRRLTLELLSDTKSRNAFDQIVLFFDELAACVESALCDHNTAQALLKDPAQQIASAYGYYVVHIRGTYGNERYASGLFKTRSMEKEFNFWKLTGYL